MKNFQENLEHRQNPSMNRTIPLEFIEKSSQLASHERGLTRRAKDSRNVFGKEAKRCMHTHEVGIRYLTAFSASGKALTVAWGAPR